MSVVSSSTMLLGDFVTAGTLVTGEEEIGGESGEEGI
jgi:hypothetical protein